MEITGADRYQPDKLPQLEKYVDEQVSTSTYNLSANLTVLRLYQLQPEVTRTATVARILLKALMALPNPDFETCMYMVPERLQSEEPISTILLLAQHLEACRFADFWLLTSSCRDLLTSVPGFYDAVRAHMLHVMVIGCHRLPKRLLGESLALTGSALEGLIADKVKSAGWTVNEDVVFLPRAPLAASSQTKRARGTIPLDMVASLVQPLLS